MHFLFLFLASFFCLCTSALAQSASPPAPGSYPELAWLGRSSYCNPYFGLRFALPRELKPEPIDLPVQSNGRHMLLAQHLRRLDRSAQIFISAFEDPSEDAARLAARAHLRQARAASVSASGPHALSAHRHPLYRLHSLSATNELGGETSYFFTLRGYVLHVAIFSQDDTLAAAIGSSIERLEFFDPAPSACAPSAAGRQPPEALPRLHYGPALPTALVESTLRERPGNSVPAGQFSHGTFTDSALGLRFELPPGWQPTPIEESYRVTELMRDPVADRESGDRRRALFRACSRVIFAAADPRTDLAPNLSPSQMHPALAILAMPQGCVPDLVPPTTLEDRAASEEFATLLVRSLGVLLLQRGHIQERSAAGLTLRLDGVLSYQLPGEMLTRRLSLRLSATASGPWLIFVYSVADNLAAQRELESRITIGPPEVGSSGHLPAAPSH